MTQEMKLSEQENIMEEGGNLVGAKENLPEFLGKSAGSKLVIMWFLVNSSNF